MKASLFVCAAIAAALVPTVAAADDPNDPMMGSAAARARDRQMIRQLNRQELAKVRERDARYSEGWRIARGSSNFAAPDLESSRRLQDYERAQENYSRDRAVYERDMAQWRRAAAACRAGNYSGCDD